MTITILAIRNEFPISTAAIVQVFSETLENQEEVLSALRDATTDWILETEQGKAAWQNTAEDFNFGDLGLMDPSFIPYLNANGINDIKFISADEDAISFDYIIPDQERLVDLSTDLEWEEPFNE